MSLRVPEMKGICAIGGHSFLSMYHVPLVEFMCLVFTKKKKKSETRMSASVRIQDPST